MEVDEDDPVVQEVDVFLSKQLATNLLLLQYPVRPAHLTYDDAEVISAKIKPKQQHLTYEVALNTRSTNYCRSKGEQIAINVDGPAVSRGVNAMYKSDKMDKQVLTSQPSGSSTKRYVIGYLKDGELHLTPLKSILHMRPNFNYMDQSDARKGKAADGADSQDEEEEAKAVTVKFARRETEEAKARRLASYEYLRKKQEEELWVSLNHHAIGDFRSENERQLLYAHNTNDEQEFHMQPDAFLEKLLPKLEEIEQEKAALPSNVLSMADLKKMSVADQVKSLMKNAKLIGYNQMMSYLPKGTDGVSVLRCLQQVALLVQGCWVVKSEVLYGKDSRSAHSGADAEMLCRGRDYIMWRFTQNRCIVRKDITSVIKLHAEDVKDMLEQMSRLKVKSGWEFKLSYDYEFVNKYPDIVQRQQMLWEAKFKQLSSQLKMPPVDHKLAAQAAASTTPPRRRRTVSRSRTKSGDKSAVSDYSDTDDVSGMRSGGSGSERSRRASGTGGGASAKSSRERLRSNSGSGDRAQQSPCPSAMTSSASEQNSMAAASASANAAPPQISPLTAARSIQFSLNANGSTLNSNGSTSSSVLPPPPPASSSVVADIKQELTAFLRNKLHSYFVLKMSDIKSLVTMELTTLPPGHILSKGVTEQHIDDVIQIAGGIRMLSGQIACGEPVFAVGGVGDNRDIIRTTLVDKMQKQPKIQAKALKQAVADAHPDIAFTDDDYKKVLSEYCERPYRGNVYYLKGVKPPTKG